MQRFKKIAHYFAGHYTLDLRALALMRMCIALLVLADLIIRGSDLSAHYTDEGLWPRRLIPNFGWNPGFWSIHTLSGSYGWELFLFLVHGAAALCLLVGYRSRLATFVVWLLTISLHNRNLFVLQSGDDLLRLTLLWGLFLPWHARYSLDAKRGRVYMKRNTWANLGYLMLIASVYFFTSLFKSSPEWHRAGTAIYYALSLEQLRLPYTGDWLYQFPGLMKALTWLVYYTELLVPLLILIPEKKGRLRFIAFLLLLLLHLGIGLTLYVGLFFIINIISALGLLPGFVMNKFETLLRVKKNTFRFKKQAPVLKWLSAGGCVLLILLSLLVNLGAVSWFPYQARSEVRFASNALRLNQYWAMFSPTVLKTDGWFVYLGGDSLGRQWDLRLNQDYVDYSKPAHIVSMYKSDRWRKLAENMQGNQCTFLRTLYGQYMLQSWNKNHPEKKLKSLHLYFMQKTNLPNYRSTAPEKILFCLCIDE